MKYYTITRNFDGLETTYDKGTHTRLSDIPTDYFGYNSEGPLSKHSTVQRYQKNQRKMFLFLLIKITMQKIH